MLRFLKIKRLTGPAGAKPLLSEARWVARSFLQKWICARIRRAQICLCERLALILTFSKPSPNPLPKGEGKEKEQPSEALGNMFDRPVPSAVGFSKRRPPFLPLPRQWERAGVRVARKYLPWPNPELRPPHTGCLQRSCNYPAIRAKVKAAL
jgi:hypothetical protein